MRNCIRYQGAQRWHPHGPIRPEATQARHHGQQGAKTKQEIRQQNEGTTPKEASSRGTHGRGPVTGHDVGHSVQ